MDKNIEKLAHMIVNYSCAVKPGEHVMIKYDGDETLKMVRALMREIYAACASPYPIRIDKVLERELILAASEDQLKTMCRHELGFYEDMDVFLSVRANHNEYEFSDIPTARMGEYFKHYAMPCVMRRMKNDRWAGISYPCPSEAQAMGMSQQAYEDYFFKVCTMDYPKMYKACLPLRALMDRTDKVQLKGPGTDITFSIKGIGSKICAGDHNIPDGEVFSAPVRDSVDGVVSYNIPNVVDGFCYENIRLTFKDGKIVDLDCNDPARMNEYFNCDEGARYVGEFAIGFNPYITKPMKNTAFDEKIAGSFHLTPGMSIDTASNGNVSNIHCDLVCIQTKEMGGGEIWFDDVLIRKDGIFVLEELKGLNPDNLL